MATVLVVDDNAANRDLVVTLLRYKGHRALEAADGADGLALARSARPSLIVCDILMPTMDGYEFVRQLRADPDIAATEVIFYTANYHGEQADGLARACGVSRVLVKPAEPEAILEMIDQALAVEPTPGPAAIPDAFDREHLRLVTDSLSEKATMLERAHVRLSALTDMNLRLASERDPNLLMDQVCGGARELLGAKYAVLCVKEKGNGAATHVSLAGVDADTLRTLPPPALDNEVLATVIRERKPLRALNPGRDPRRIGLPENYPPADAVLACPITSLDSTYGWVALCEKPGADGFSAEDERLLSIYAAQAGRIYENGSLYLQMQRHTDRLRESEARLRESDAGLRRAQLMARLAHVITGPDGVFESWSDTLPALAGADLAGMPRTTRDWVEIVHPDDRATFRRTAIEAGVSMQRRQVEYRLRRGDGWVHIRQMMEPIEGAGGRWFGTLQDITEMQRAEIRIRGLNRMHAVLSGINTLIVRVRDRDELFAEACRIAVDAGQFRLAWIGLVDRAALQVMPVAWHGKRDDYFVPTAMAIDRAEPDTFGIASRVVTSGQPFVVDDLRDTQSRGRWTEAAQRELRSAAVLPLSMSGEVVGVIALYSDEHDFFDDEEMKLLLELASDIGFALDYMAKEAKLDYLDYYDALTGLPNSTLFRDRLRQLIEAASRDGHTVALYFIDLDRFTQVNDTMGRSAGDELLKRVAERIAATLPKASSLSRISADTFAAAVVRPRDGASASASFLEGEIFAALARGFTIADRALLVSACAGIALYPGDGADADALFKNAEVALQRAKTSAEKYLFYTREMNATVAERLTLEHQLREAVAAQQFVLMYQPIVASGTGDIVGAEALIRWQHPTQGLLAPDRFLAIAEDIDITTVIGDWTLRTACAEAKRWHDAGWSTLTVSVNLSARQFRDDTLVQRVAAALAAAGLDAGGLELELTENIVMQNPEQFIAKLHALKAMGISLALDDFGTGYSSLSYLKRFPLDALKIDQSFIRDVISNPDDAAIVRAVVSVGHSLGLDVVAEGVESAAQLAWLRRQRCERVQGFYFSRAVTADDFMQLLRAGKRLASVAGDAAPARRTLLVVDDEPNIVAAVVRLLRRENYRVLTAHSAAEAFEVLASQDVEVIISDHRMPAMTGAEFLGKVKTLYPDTVRMLFSGHVEVEALTDAVNRGAVYRFLLKPWDDETLRQSVREAFQYYWLTHRDGAESHNGAKPPAA